MNESNRYCVSYWGGESCQGKHIPACPLFYSAEISEDEMYKFIDAYKEEAVIKMIKEFKKTVQKAKEDGLLGSVEIIG